MNFDEFLWKYHEQCSEFNKSINGSLRIAEKQQLLLEDLFERIKKLEKKDNA